MEIIREWDYSEENPVNKIVCADKPMSLEIGCGNGLFLSTISSLHKEEVFVGLEIKMKCILRAQKKCNLLVEQGKLNDENIWWFDGEPITFKTPTAPKILRMLWADSKTTESEVISMLGINRSAVQKQLNNLQKKGYILKADGKWYVSITPSM